MNMPKPARPASSTRGSTIMEFSLMALALFMLMLGFVEICRMVLVYDDIAHATRTGVRYAIVHGSTATGDPYGPCGSSKSAVQNTVINSFGLLTPGDVTVNCPDQFLFFPGGGNPGNRVQVTVQYRYVPSVTYFPGLDVRFSNTSEGVIAF